MFELSQTAVFEDWIEGLRDRRAQERIAIRLVRLTAGLFGDCKAVGGGVRELRIDYEPGYRMYFTQVGGSWSSCSAAATRAHRLRISSGRKPWYRSWSKGMAMDTTSFDPAQYITTEDAQRALLADAIESGDAGYIAAALGTVARARGMSQVALEAGVTREALYKSLSEGGDPRLSTFLGVARALGVKLTLAPAE